MKIKKFAIFCKLHYFMVIALLLSIKICDARYFNENNSLAATDAPSDEQQSDLIPIIVGCSLAVFLVTIFTTFYLQKRGILCRETPRVIKNDNKIESNAEDNGRY